MNKKSKIKVIIIFFLIVFLVLTIIILKAQTITTFNNINKTYNNFTQEITLKNQTTQETLIRAKLIKNTKTCFTSCEAIINISTTKNLRLINNLNFLNLKNKKINLKNYNIYLFKGYSIINVPKYSEVCNVEAKNSSVNCNYIKNGTTLLNQELWEVYNNSYLKAGNYKIKITGEKPPYQTIEWVPDFLGVNITEWALWGASDGIVAYYEMDEGGVATDGYNSTQDETGHGHNLTTGAGKPYWNDTTQALLGQSLNCSESAIVNISNNSLFDLNTSGSVSLWFYQVTKDDRYSVMFKGTNESNQNRIQIGYGIFGDDLNIETQSNDLINGSPINLNTWHHVVVTLNVNNLTLWIDGLPSNSSTIGPAYKLNWSQQNLGSPMGLCSPGGDDQWFHGFIDEVGIWNITLTKTDISNLYNGGIGLAFGSSILTANITSPSNYTNVTSQYNIEINCSSSTTNAKILNISFWNNGTGTWAINQTLDTTGSGNTSVNASFKVNFTDYNNFTYNCVAENNESQRAWNNDGNYTILLGDLTKPNLTILSPSTDTTSPNIIINISGDDNVALNNCSFNITKGASLEKANTELDITKKPYLNYTYTLSGEGTYVINTRCNDTSHRYNVSNFSFSYSTASTSPGGGGTTGGTVIIAGEKGWSMEVSEGNSRYDINMVSGTSRKLNIQFENLGDSSREITFSCVDFTGNICGYIEFPEKTFTLALLKDTKQRKNFIINLPETIENGNFQFNIRATDDLARYGDISVFLKVGGTNFFTKLLIKLTSSTSYGIPYILIFAGISIISFIFFGLLLRKVPLRALWVIIISLSLSFMGVTFL